MAGWELIARPRKVRWFAWVGAVLMLATMVVVAVLLRTVPTGVYFRLSDQVAMVLLGVLMAGGLLLFTRPRVRAGASGVEVRNVFSTQVYEWAAVCGFSFSDGATWGRLELADDEYVPLLAIQVVDGAPAVAAMRRLRALYAEHGADSASDEPAAREQENRDSR